MPYILSIESSGQICSVALSKGVDIIDTIESAEPNIHGEKLAPFIFEILKRNQLKTKDLNAVALSEGPGSYTGLRIGSSLAKGICYASQIPLIAIDTLLALAFGIKQNIDHLEDNAILMPMIDARRMEVYTAGFTTSLIKTIQTAPIIIDNAFYDALKDNLKYYTAGSGSFKIDNSHLKNPMIWCVDVQLSAKLISPLALNKFNSGEFVDLAYFEPVYLKEFAQIIGK